MFSNLPCKFFHFFVLIFIFSNATFAKGDLTRQNPISITIKMASQAGVSHSFIPNTIKLETGKLYKISLVNDTNEKHYFSSPKFANSVFTRKVQVVKDGKRLAEIKGIIKDLEVFPKATLEWWLVPIQTGVFDDLHCHVMDKKAGKTHEELGMTGKVVVK